MNIASNANPFATVAHSPYPAPPAQVPPQYAQSASPQGALPVQHQVQLPYPQAQAPQYAAPAAYQPAPQGPPPGYLPPGTAPEAPPPQAQPTEDTAKTRRPRKKKVNQMPTLRLGCRSTRRLSTAGSHSNRLPTPSLCHKRSQDCRPSRLPPVISERYQSESCATSCLVVAGPSSSHVRREQVINDG